MVRRPGLSRPRAAAGSLLGLVVLAACSSGAAGEVGDGGPEASGSGVAPTASSAQSSSPAQSASAPSGSPAPTSLGEVATDAAPPTGSAAPAAGPGEGRAQVAVTTTYVGQEGTAGVQANGYVVGVVEVDGTCTLTLTRGAVSRTATAPGLADASTTVCGGLEVPRSELAPGEWEAVLDYSSPTSRGAAAAIAVVVQ